MKKVSPILLLAAILLTQLGVNQRTHAQGSCATPDGSGNFLAMYALAFDNLSYEPQELSDLYDETLAEIVSATEANGCKTAVILSDLPGENDTKIAVVHQGNVTNIVGLPNGYGNLSTAVTEYDMSNGQHLGQFLKWAVNNYRSQDQKAMFSFVGHGAPLVPENGEVSGSVPPPPTESNGTMVLPSWVYVNPGYTDAHPVGVISPADLRDALDMATNGGSEPLDIVDLAHCFALTIEEVYEIAPYTETVTGSPSYMYFSAQILGRALSAINQTEPINDIATTIVQTYDTVLPNDGFHPRILVALKTDHMQEIKNAWDNTATELLNAFNQNETSTRQNIATAYQQSAKYDTTMCDLDWELAPPDALSDISDFATQLSNQFGASSGVGQAASTTVQLIEDSVILTNNRPGQPWFAHVDPRPHWDFTGTGLALYTDFEKMEYDGQGFLSWQANSYLHPENGTYAFLEGNTTWIDVLNRYWDGQDTAMTSCYAVSGGDFETSSNQGGGEYPDFGNDGGNYRSDQKQIIWVNGNPSAHLDPGEWVGYTLAGAGEYDLVLEMTSGWGSSDTAVSVAIGNNPATAQTLPATGDWNVSDSITFSNVTVAEGEQIYVQIADSQAIIVKVTALGTPSSPPDPTPTPAPTSTPAPTNPPPSGNELQNGVSVNNISGGQGSETRYTMSIPANATNLQFQMSGGSGDADLYVRFGNEPTTGSYDCRPYLNGNNETCTISNIQTGTYHIMLRAYAAYSGVSLVGSYDSGEVTPAPTSAPPTATTIPPTATAAPPTATPGSGGAAGRYEAEDLQRSGSDGISIYNSSSASGGQWVRLSGNAVGDYIEFTLNVSESGTYNISYGFKYYSTRGVIQMSIDGQAHGGSFDQSNGSGYHSFNLGDKTLSAGTHTIRFEVTGSGTSGGEQISVDYIELQ